MKNKLNKLNKNPKYTMKFDMMPDKPVHGTGMTPDEWKAFAKNYKNSEAYKNGKKFKV